MALLLSYKILAQIKIYGIRHHGAGSARRLYDSLIKYKPDIICVEMPYEANNILEAFSQSEHHCPLAIMYYNPDHPDQSLYYPFAEFSPEYQALRFGFENRIPMKAIDLPAGMSLINSNFKTKKALSLSNDQLKMVNDPIGYLAMRSGYEDAELWWNTYFESWKDGDDLFDTVNQLMCQLRESSHGQDDEETLIREEFMRDQIQKISKDYEKIAVVCGAWHSPVFLENTNFKIINKDYKTLKQISINTSIIPWSYERLVMSNNYTAGIESPTWSECVFTQESYSLSRWLAQAAEILRKRGIIISTAEIIDCERLAKDLALIRNLAFPGVNELMESVITVMGRNDDERLQLIRKEIFVGNKTGSINLNTDTLSVVVEFKNEIKKLKLKSYWQADCKETLSLDLRTERHLEISRFLHRSCLLELNWCETYKTEINARGNFHEDWKFEWTDEHEIFLAHVAVKGSTIEEVIIRNIEEKLEKSNDLLLLAKKLEHALKGNITSPWLKILDKIKQKSFDTSDVVQLSQLLEPFISCIQYGSLNAINIQEIIAIIQFLLPKIILEFNQQCTSIKEERAKKLIDTYSLINKYFIHSKDSEFHELWNQECHKLSTNDLVHPMIRGFVWNKLLESKVLTQQELEKELNFQFIYQKETQKTASWIEGFLYQTSSFFLFQEMTLDAMNHWLMEMEEEGFKSTLPLLRRSFSQLGPNEIRKIKAMLQKRTGPEIVNNDISIIINPDRYSKIEKMLNQYFKN